MSNKEHTAEMGKNNNFIKNLEVELLNSEGDLSKLTAEQQFDLIASKAAIHPEAIIPKPNEGQNELLQLLKKSKNSGRPLRIKLGVDATGPNIHFGHAISLLMLRRFQQMGHHIDLVVGDFTAKIGDPSDRISERKVLTDDEIRKNMATYVDQASRIVDLSKSRDVNVFFNSEWLSKMTMADWIPLLQRISGSKLIEREDFTKRLQAGNMVSAAEMMYPLFMAYDSVVINPDIELGGVDQLLNFHWCRELMKLSNQKSEAFVLVDMLPGTSGEVDNAGQFVKMSKSKHNFIMVMEEPVEVYGKAMSIPDEVMWIWYRELTEISTNDLVELKNLVDTGVVHPMDVKKLLARSVVGTFNHYDKSIIQSAEEAFDQKFGKRKILVPADIQPIQGESGERLIDLLSRSTGESKANMRKMTTSAGPSGIKVLEGDTYRDISTKELLSRKLEKGEIIIIKLGKRRYFKIST